jgi:hypothetical protein
MARLRSQRDWQAARQSGAAGSTLKSMPFDFGAWTDGIGEAGTLA